MEKKSVDFQSRDFASEIINKKRNILNKSKIPQNLLLICWLFILSSGGSLLGGIFLILIAPSFTGKISNPSTGILEPFLPLLTKYVILVGIFFIVLSVIFFFISKGLKKGKKWARISAIIIFLIGFASSILGIISGGLESILSLVATGIIVQYLLFNKKIKEFFS